MTRKKDKHDYYCDVIDQLRVSDGMLIEPCHVRLWRQWKDAVYKMNGFAVVLL